MNEPYQNELACTWSEFQKRGKEFIDVLPSIEEMDELEGAWDAIAYGYLNLTGNTEQELHQAALLLQILGRKKLEKEIQIQDSYWANHDEKPTDLQPDGAL